MNGEIISFLSTIVDRHSILLAVAMTRAKRHLVSQTQVTSDEPFHSDPPIPSASLVILQLSVMVDHISRNGLRGWRLTQTSSTLASNKNPIILYCRSARTALVSFGAALKSVLLWRRNLHSGVTETFMNYE